MLVKDAQNIKGIKIPKFFSNKIVIGTTCDLDDEIVRLFNISLQETFEQLYFVDYFNEEFEPKYVNVLFTSNGHLEFLEEENSTTFAEYTNLIVYKMDKINTMKSEIEKMFVFIEELAHHYWQIEDEVKVKFKVVEILKRYDNTITLTEEKDRWRVSWKTKRKSVKS